MWLFFALLSALFAALTSILAKTWNRWSKFKSGNRHPDRCSRSDGLGNGISYPCSKRNFFDWKKKLDFSHPVRPCHRRLLALLLPCITAGRRLKSCSCG
mgnify:CR=1 FL=1